MASCEVCGSHSTVSIQLELGDGTGIEFKTCHRCEWKAWDSPEGRVPLAKVLQLASANKPK